MPRTALAHLHAAVVGSGITGLAAARVLSDRGARVTILERDAEPDAADPASAFASWQRKGAPQVRHSHAFLGRLRSLLRDKYPDILQGLLDVGAAEPDMLAHPPLTLPPLTPWVDPAVSEPIGDAAHPVQAMGGLINRLRRFVVDGAPLARGFIALGDAAYCTNPLYGRGCAQAFLHADLLGEALDAAPDDLAAAARELETRARAALPAACRRASSRTA